MIRMFRKYCWCWLFYAVLFLTVLNAAAQDGRTVGNIETDTARVSWLIRQSNILRASSGTDSALILLSEALKISKAMHFDEGVAGSMLCIAFCYQDKGDYKRSKSLLYQALPYCIHAEKNNKRILLSLYNGLGGTYALLGNNDSAVHFLYKALEVIDESPEKDSFMLLQIYSNLGTAWMQKNEITKSLKYQKKAATLALRLKDSLSLANIYATMGASFLEQRDTIAAMSYFGSALDIYKQKGNRRGIQYVYYSMGNAQADQHKAISLYRDALNIDSTSAFTAGIYQGLGKAYYLLGAYGKAEPWYRKSELICRQQGLLTHRLANYSALSSIYEHLGAYESAYRYQVAYANLNDSLLNTEKEKAVNQLDIKFRISEKDKILAQNKAQLYRQQQWIIGFGTGGLLLTFLCLAIYQRSRYKHRMQSVHIRNFDQQKKIDQLHAKMQGEEEERSRIARELHDGVNVLLSATKMNYAALGKEFRDLPETTGYGEVMALLNEMGLELRTITYKLVPELLIQQSLPDAVETFCELIRKGKNLYIEFQSWGSFTALPAEYCFAIYRVVQELVHNIIKHAHATSTLIQLRHQGDLLCLTVEDNGVGFDPERPGNGLGLKSIRSRVEDLGGSIAFTSTNGEGTSIEVELVTEKRNV